MRKPRVRKMRLETTSGRRKIRFTRHGIRRKWRPIQTWGPRLLYFPPESTERQVRKCVHRDLPGVSQFASLLESSRRHNGYSSNLWRVISLHVAQIRRPGDTGDKWEALHVTAHLAADSCFFFFFPSMTQRERYELTTLQELKELTDNRTGLFCCCFSVFINKVIIYASGYWRAAQ